VLSDPYARMHYDMPAVIVMIIRRSVLQKKKKHGRARGRKRILAIGTTLRHGLIVSSATSRRRSTCIRQTNRLADFSAITQPLKTAFPANCFACAVLWRVFSWLAPKQAKNSTAVAVRPGDTGCTPCGLISGPQVRLFGLQSVQPVSPGLTATSRRILA